MIKSDNEIPIGGAVLKFNKDEILTIKENKENSKENEATILNFNGKEYTVSLEKRNDKTIYLWMISSVLILSIVLGLFYL